MPTTYEKKITDIDQFRRTRKNHSRFRWLLIVVFFVVCMFAGYFFAISPFFAVKEIAVTGNAQISSQRIIQLSGIENGTNIFAVNEDAVERWLRIEPKIQSVDISRSLNGKIVIKITERKAVAVISVDNAFIDIDIKGRILSRYKTLDDYQLPLLTGLSGFESIAAPGCFIEVKGITEALAIISALPDNAADIGEINVTDTQQIRLYTLGGTELRIGNTEDISEKYLLISGILANHTESGTVGMIDYIDVSSSIPVVTYN